MPKEWQRVIDTHVKSFSVVPRVAAASSPRDTAWACVSSAPLYEAIRASGEARGSSELPNVPALRRGPKSGNLPGNVPAPNTMALSESAKALSREAAMTTLGATFSRSAGDLTVAKDAPR